MVFATDDAEPRDSAPRPALLAETDLLEQLPLHAMLVDARHRIVYANRAAREAFCVGPRLVPGTTCTKLVHGLGHACPDCPLEKALEAGGSPSSEVLDPRSGRWFRTTVCPTQRLTPDGLPVWLHLAEDVTERRRLEEERDFLQQVERVVGELLRIGLEPLTLDELLGLMLDRVLSVPWLGLRPQGAVFLLAGDGKTLELRVSRGMSEGNLRTCARVPSGHCLCGRAALEGTVQFSETVDDRHENRYPGLQPHGHYCLPVRSQGGLLGVLCLYVDEGHRRSRREESFLSAVTDVMAGVIQYQRTLALFEQAAVGVAQVQVPSGRFLRVNRKLGDVLGWTPEELAGKTLAEVTDPGELALHRGDMARLQRGEVRAFSAERRCRHRSGDEVWVNLSVSAMSAPGATPDSCVAVVEDVTARKAAEDALRRSEGRFRGLFEAMTEGVALHEILRDEGGEPVDYRLVEVNPAYSTHTGIPQAEAVGRRASELYGTGRAPYLDVYARVVATSQPTRFEIHFAPMDRHFRISAFPAGEDRFATVFADITESKRLQLELAESNAELQARNRDLDAFAHMVAHDLKTPLTTLASYSGVLEQGPGLFSDGGQEAVAAISRSSRRLARIVDELLLLAQTRKAEVASEPLDMAAVVAASLRDLEPLIRDCLGEVTAPSAWPVARGHAPWVEQVWTNYIGNALKHGGEPPRVRLGADREAHGLVRFWVEDNGEGLTEEEQARLFVPFSRLAQARAHGHGLGLSIVRHIVEKLGGTVAVSSPGPGQGAVFSFTLPAAG